MTHEEHSIRGSVRVGALLAALRAELDWELSLDIGDAGREVASHHIQKPGLILSGLWEYLDPQRVQVLGRSELAFITRQADSGLVVGGRLCQDQPPLIVVSRGMPAPAGLETAAAQAGVPLAISQKTTAEVIERLTAYLRGELAPRRDVHGVLVEVFGVGVLLLGESGVGKSESALELLTRGHRLVADDRGGPKAVDGRLLGTAPKMTRDHLDVRGLGIVNARQMFGVASAKQAKQVEMVARLVRVEETDVRTKFDCEPEAWEMLGVRVPSVEVPVAPGRSLAVLIETAVRQHLLREQGYDAGSELRSALAEKLGAQVDQEGS